MTVLCKRVRKAYATFVIVLSPLPAKEIRFLNTVCNIQTETQCSLLILNERPISFCFISTCCTCNDLLLSRVGFSSTLYETCTLIHLGVPLFPS